MIYRTIYCIKHKNRRKLIRSYRLRRFLCACGLLLGLISGSFTSSFRSVSFSLALFRSVSLVFARLLSFVCDKFLAFLLARATITSAEEFAIHREDQDDLPLAALRKSSVVLRNFDLLFRLVIAYCRSRSRRWHFITLSRLCRFVVLSRCGMFCSVLREFVS